MTNATRRGLTNVELLVVVLCILVVPPIVIVILDQFGGSHRGGLSAKDATQIAQTHKSLLIYSADAADEFPLPGKIRRLPYELTMSRAGIDLPGIGPEDESLNTTANLYSALIAQNFFNTELMVSPLERNPEVRELVDYDYDTYQPALNSYWDPRFVADLQSGSNASYAHQPMSKDRRAAWRKLLVPDLAQVGNRGPVDGRLDAHSYACDSDGNWTGNIAFGDNHVDRFASPTSASLNSDNLFKAEDRKRDAFLTFTKIVKDGVPEFQFD